MAPARLLQLSDDTIERHGSSCRAAGATVALAGPGGARQRAREVSFAAEIKAVNPKAKVLVSRNSEVGTVVWDAIRPLLDTPLHAEASGLWVHSENRRNHGQIANGTWDCDNCGLPPKPTAIPYGKLFFNWTSQKFSDWWLHTHIGDAITDENGIDGVYFDCCCGAPPGIPQGAKEKRIFLRRFHAQK